MCIRDRGTSVEVWSWGVEDAINGYDNGRMLSESYFYYDTISHSVMKHSFETNKTTEFTHDIPNLSALSGGAPFDCFIDNMIFITNGLDFYGAYSDKDSSLIKISLSYSEDNKEKPIRIIDQVGDSYLVVAGSEETILHGFDQSGLPADFPSVVDKIALIDKNDYLTNQPNFRWLERLS